jgi:hypothetical protein
MNGTRLADCPSGTACSLTYTPAAQGDSLVAFISGDGTGFPPPGIVASSSVIATRLQILT